MPSSYQFNVMQTQHGGAYPQAALPPPPPTQHYQYHASGATTGPLRAPPPPPPEYYISVMNEHRGSYPPPSSSVNIPDPQQQQQQQGFYESRASASLPGWEMLPQCVRNLFFSRPYWVVRSRLWYDVLSVCHVLSVCRLSVCL